MYKPPLIGCDPELFVVNRQHRFVSVHGFLPGTKDNPYMVEKGAVQADGTAAEFNIKPAATAEEFSDNIRTVLLQLQELIQKHDKSLRLRVTPTATFTKKYFKRLPIEALRLGCEPDFDAYTNRQTTPPSTDLPFRTGGGHVHIGWGENLEVKDTHHIYDCIVGTQQLDAVLYVSSLLWDQDKKRRTLYGKIGAFRPKPYGVEYRPLSNAWVADPDLHLWIFNATRWAFEKLEGEGVELYSDKEIRSVVDCLRSGGDVSATDLRDYHYFLHDDFGMPLLPESYLKVA